MWLGINLRQRGKCRLVVPDWMDAEKLAEKKEEESQSKVLFLRPLYCHMTVYTVPLV